VGGDLGDRGVQDAFALLDLLRVFHGSSSEA